ncbi:MAG: SLC13 family permease [Halobacteriota archaeon]
MDQSLLIALFVFIITYALLATERIDKTIVVGLASFVLLVTGILNLQEAIFYVNWETIGLLFGMFIIVVVLSDSGFFSYLALILAKTLSYDPKRIFILFPLLAGLLAAFINSITVMLFLAVLTFEISKLLKIDPVPIIVGEVVLANTGGAATLIGDPPNVILGTQLGLGFNDFIIHNGPIALAASLVSISVLYLMCRKSLQSSTPIKVESIQTIDPGDAITNRRGLQLGLGALSLAIVLLATHSYLQSQFGVPLTVALSALIPAFLLLLAGGSDMSYVLKKVDYHLLLFFIGLFILVGALEKTGAIRLFASGLLTLAGGNNGTLLSLLLWGSAAISAVVDNIPFALTMSYVVKDIAVVPGILATSAMVWAISLGTDIGGNGTPIGASSNVVAYDSMEKHGLRIGWLRWMKLAIPPTFVALIVCNVLLYAKYAVGFY